MARLAKKDCSRCNRGEGETFWCMKNRYVFDIDAARTIAATGHEAMELDPDDVAFSVGRCEINEGHLPHVDPGIPGIVAHVFFPNGDGTTVRGHRLIDGHHRAARCLQLGIPYRVYVLTEEESVKILMKAPKGARRAGNGVAGKPRNRADRKRVESKRKRGATRKACAEVG